MVLTQKTYVAIAVALFASIIGGVLTYKHVQSNKLLPISCPVDTMACPDGSSVPRSGPNCEFSICKNTSILIEESTSSPEISSPFKPLSPSFDKTPLTSPVSPRPENAPSKKLTPSRVFAVTKEAAASFIHNVGSSFTNNTENSSQNTSPSSQQTNTSPVPPQQQTTAQQPEENKLTIVDNNIINGQGQVVGTIPPPTGGGSWETHTVSVIEVGSTTPIIGGVPVVGSVGKYYVSENSFGSLELCEFSNKIYILDTKTEVQTLLYEENSSSLSKDDPRACTSEMILLATEEEKLVLKYHTIQTNTLCDSSWSEPEKTWFLDVTKITEGMKKYNIPLDRYNAAEAEEVLCRQKL